MQPFRVVAILDAIADSVRAELVAPVYGHPAYAEVARGYGPCRLCLRTFTVGADRRILFTYDSFQDKEALPLPGPVYIHEVACERYPEDGGFPEDLRQTTCECPIARPASRAFHRAAKAVGSRSAAGV